MFLPLDTQAVPPTGWVAVACIGHQSAHSNGGMHNFAVALHSCACCNERGQKNVGEVAKMGWAVVTAEVDSGQGAEAIEQRGCTTPLEPLLVLLPPRSKKASQYHRLIEDTDHLHPHRHFC